MKASGKHVRYLLLHNYLIANANIYVLFDITDEKPFTLSIRSISPVGFLFDSTSTNFAVSLSSIIYLTEQQT